MATTSSVGSSCRTFRRLRSALAWTVSLICCAIGTVALAQDVLTPYSDRPLTSSDFTGTVPPPAGRFDTDGAAISAFIKTDIGFTVPSTLISGPDGAKVVTATEIKLVAGIIREKSWIIEPENKELLDHERGHHDLAEAAARKAQAEINEKLKDAKLDATKDLKGRGTTVEEALADLRKKIVETTTRHLKDVDKAYDKKTGHGLKKEEQKKEREKQKAALKDANKDPARKEGANATSESKKSISFDAGLQRLTLDHDFIVGVQSPDASFIPDPFDPILGAQLTLPTFSLEGQTGDGEFYFRADGINPRLQLTDGSITYFSADLDYLLYDTALNMFYGLTKGFESLDGLSQFIDEMVKAGTSGELSLFGVEFFPDHDFLAATAGFTASASDSFQNGAGQRQLASVPEPSTLALFGFAALVLLGCGSRHPRIVTRRCKRAMTMRTNPHQHSIADPLALVI